MSEETHDFVEKVHDTQKKDKKNKESKDKEQAAPTVETNGDADEKKKEKKDKKKKDKKNKDQADESTTATATDAPNGTSNGTSNGEGEGIDLDESSSKKNDRHIVFVGNLPYSATAASISAHFASLSPIAVRCLTKKGEKDPNVTCKGIAFVEFANVWTQRTCLDKFHHSMFDDKKSAARRINVELTAGGGGKNTNRHEKIAEKNRKLDENRAKRIDREKTTKAESAAVTHLDDAIHPSRRGRVPGSGY
ncbi:hypothetical protein Golomagni_06514 [Golovinomyces magnicellulatus]|nr:hypothetical protein Golomagni_06514 [Golovinomyces magnicellulatus]